MSYVEWIRELVGNQKIFLAYTSVVLRNQEGHVLLQHRTDMDIWGLPGGVLEPGEDIEACARRELLEETGLIAGDLSLVGVYTDPKYDAVYPNGDQVQQYTVCLQGLVAGGEMRPDGIETSEQQFFHHSEIPYDELPNFYQDMLQDALQGSPPSFRPPFMCPNPVNQVDLMRAGIGKSLFIGVGATSVVLRNDGKLLMVKRIENNRWCLPAGYMHIGETVAHSAVREAHEESGLDIVPTRILGIYTPKSPWVYPNGDRVQPVITVFLCHAIGGKLGADNIETSHVQWMTTEEVLALDTHPILARLNKAVVQHLADGYFLL